MPLYGRRAASRATSHCTFKILNGNSITFNWKNIYFFPTQCGVARGIYLQAAAGADRIMGANERDITAHHIDRCCYICPWIVPIHIYTCAGTGEVQVSMRFPVGIQVASAMRRLLVQLICRVICVAPEYSRWVIYVCDEPRWLIHASIFGSGTLRAERGWGWGVCSEHEAVLFNIISHELVAS